MDLLQVPDGEHPFGDEAAETAFRKLFGEDHFEAANRLIWTCHHYDEIPPVTTPADLVTLIDDLLSIYDRLPEHLVTEKKLEWKRWRENALQSAPLCLDASLAEQLGNDRKLLNQWLQDHYPHLIAVFDKSFEDPPYEPIDVYDHVRRHLRSRAKRTDGHFETDHCWGQPLVAWEHFPDAPALSGDAKAAVDELRVWAVKKAAQTMGDNGLITRPNGTANAVMHEETLRLVGDGAGGKPAAAPLGGDQGGGNAVSTPPAVKPDEGKGNGKAEAHNGPVAQSTHAVPGTKKPRRSTERGEGRLKLIAALTKHHQYAEGGCLNLEPIGNNELARLADVDQATASAFFRKQFKGHAKYKVACRNAGLLTAALKVLNGEFSPHLLYGGKPPDEDDREEE